MNKMDYYSKEKVIFKTADECKDIVKNEKVKWIDFELPFKNFVILYDSLPVEKKRDYKTIKLKFHFGIDFGPQFYKGTYSNGEKAFNDDLNTFCTNYVRNVKYVLDVSNLSMDDKTKLIEMFCFESMSELKDMEDHTPLIIDKLLDIYKLDQKQLNWLSDRASTSFRDRIGYFGGREKYLECLDIYKQFRTTLSKHCSRGVDLPDD